MFAVFHPWFLAQHKHFDWSCDPIALGSIGDVTEMFIDFHVLLTTLCPMFTKPTQLKHQEAAQVLHTSLTATFSVGPGIFMCWISQQIYWLISLKKMHYVSHINLYTTYPYILHIHSKSWIHTRLYKYIQYIYTVHPGQTCTSPRSTGSSELPSFTWSMLIWPTEKYFAWLHRFWWLWNHPTDGFIFLKLSGRYIISEI